MKILSHISACTSFYAKEAVTDPGFLKGEVWIIECTAKPTEGARDGHPGAVSGNTHRKRGSGAEPQKLNSFTYLIAYVISVPILHVSFVRDHRRQRGIRQCKEG